MKSNLHVVEVAAGRLLALPGFPATLKEGFYVLEVLPNTEMID